MVDDDRARWLDPAKIAAVLTALAAVITAVVALRGTFGSSTETGSATSTPSARGTPSVRPSDAPSQVTATPLAGQVTPPARASSATSSPAAQPTAEAGRIEDDALIVSWSLEETDPAGGETYAFPPGTQASFGWPTDQANGPGVDPFGFARRGGGIAAGHQAVRMVIHGKSDTPVVISRLRPVMVEARSPQSMAYLVKLGYGCGIEPVRTAEFDFDRTPIRSRFSTGEGTSPDKKRKSLVLSVSRTDPETITAVGLARKADVSWALDVVYEYNGEMRSLRIDRHGDPFRVTGVSAGTPQKIYGFTSSVLQDDQPGPISYDGYC